MTWKAYSLLSGAGVIATFLMSVPASPVERSAPARKPDARARAASDIQELAVRLQSRVQAERAYQQPARNPFRFSARSSAPQAVGAASPVVAPVTAPPPVEPLPTPLPEMSLLGMTADQVGGVEQRTAILKTAQGVLLLKAGDAAGSGYTVSTIAEGVVELKSGDGSTRRITFKP
jgi:hypothetical protein